MNEKKVHQAHVALTRLKEESDVESRDDNGVDRDRTRHLEPEVSGGEVSDGNGLGTDGDHQAIDIAQMLMETIKNVKDVRRI